MLVPTIRAWIENGNDITRGWIDGTEICSLIKVASLTRQSEVVPVIRTMMLTRDDMFDVKFGMSNSVLRQPTILALITGAQADEFTGSSVHQPLFLASIERALAWMMPIRSTASIYSEYSLRSSLVSKPSLAFSANSPARVSVSASKRKA